MDILLVTPINETHYCVPSLGLGYLVSALRKAGLGAVAMLDSVKEKVGYGAFGDFLKKNEPKILGIQCYSFDVPVVKRMLAIAKKVNPRIITVIGGPHPSAVSGEVFKEFMDLDFAVQGEGEISFPLLASAILDKKGSLKNIPGLIFKNNGSVMANQANLITDLDTLDIPAWDLMDPRTYMDAVQGGFYEDFPVAPIISSRGCPYECTFCANNILMGRKIRQRSVEKVVDEIGRLSRDYGVKEIQIDDDNFTIDKRRVLDFCRIIRNKELNLKFSFPNGVRVDSLDEEVLRALKGIGAYSITVGIESGSQRILDHMRKNLKLDLIREKVKLIKRSGFIVNAFFIIGYPEETRDDIRKTVAFARELPIDIAHFSSFLPLPGTNITNHLLDSGKIDKIDYTKLFYSKTPFSPPDITLKELKSFQKRAFLSFYLRPRIILGFLIRIKSLRHLIFICRRAVDYIFSKKEVQIWTELP